MSSADLEKEVERTRGELDVTLDRLHHRLSTFGLMDETMAVLRSERFGRVGDSMITSLRRDPLPALLIAAGVGLLLYRASRPRRYPPPAPMGAEGGLSVGEPYPPVEPAGAPHDPRTPPIEPAADPRTPPER